MNTQDLVTMRGLGNMGRWGNQIFQYMFLRVYAIKYGLKYQCPRWAGQQLFGLQDPRIDHVLPPWHENRPNGLYGWAGVPPEGDEARGHDLVGYFQWHMSWYAPWRATIQDWFRLQGPMQERLGAATERFLLLGPKRIGLHFRRGDTGRLIYYLTPVQWYLDWLTEHWEALGKPPVYIATEDPQIVDRFAAYNPLTPERLGVGLTDVQLPNFVYLVQDIKSPTDATMDFFPDWWFLGHCEIVLMPNSTFSFLAAMLNPGLCQLWRSRLPTQTFERIEPWDCTPLTYDHLDDHPGIRGTQLDTNRYWQPEFKPKYKSA